MTGHLASDPNEVKTREGKALTVFRVMENQRVFDREQQQWVDGDATGYDVAVLNEQLGNRVLTGLAKGDRVTVRGGYEVSPYVNENTGAAGLNHRLGAREVSLSMFDDRFDPSVTAEREASVDAEAEHRVDRTTEQEQQWPTGFTANRAPLNGPGTPPPPGPPQAGPTLSERELQEIVQRQQHMAQQQAMHQQQYNALPTRPGAQNPRL